MQNTKHGDFACTLLVQRQHCVMCMETGSCYIVVCVHAQTSLMHGRDNQLLLFCVSVRTDRDRLHMMQVVVICLKP